MKKLLYTLAIGLWILVFIQACEIQYKDEQVLDSKAQQILAEIAAGKDQSQALADESLQLALSILDSLQAKNDVVLDDINISR